MPRRCATYQKRDSSSLRALPEINGADSGRAIR
jgi:hypothetical protein